MKWKTTLLLLAVTVGIGAYVSQVELKQPLPEERQARSKRILQLSLDDVTALAVEVPHAKVVLKKDGDTWRLTTPLNARAERSLIQRILGEVSWLDAERVLAGTKEKPLDRAPYGLAPAKGTLVISTQQGETTLLFGNPSAVGDTRYLARTDRPEVFVAGSSLFDTLNQSADSYRSRELVGIDTTRLAGLTLSSPTASYALIKENGLWRLTEPLQDAANPTAVGALLSHLNGLRIERFVDEQAEVSAHPEWGFQTPSAKLTLTVGGRATALEILIGGGTSDNAQQRYATRSDEPTLYAVTGTDVEALSLDPQTLRAKAPATKPPAATP